MCKKRCLRRKYPDLGWNFNSLTNLSEQLSEEEIIFERTNLNCGTRTSRDSATHKPEPNPPSYQLAATHFDAQSPWTLRDTPTSTPLMAVSAECSDCSPGENICVAVDIPEPNLLSKKPTACTIVDLSESSPVSVVIDAPESDSCAVVDVPDLSSPDTSFTCSSLKDTHKSIPLMAVSGCSMEKNCVTVDIPEPNPVSEEPASCIVDLSETSPVCVVVDAPKVDSCVAVIPEMNSPDTSFTCSSLFDDAFSWFS